MFEYSKERYEKFDIHKDIGHKSLNGITLSYDCIFKIIKNWKMNQVPDTLGAYKYYLMRRMNNVQKWYKIGLFDFYETTFPAFTMKMLFVVNKENGRLDNIISRSIFDEITQRIYDHSCVYAIRDHAVKRAKQRIPGLFDWKPLQVYEWLEKKTKKLRPCSLKPQYKVVALLNHGFETCKYYMDKEDRVYVVTDNLLTTIHYNEAERWVRN